MLYGDMVVEAVVYCINSRCRSDRPAVLGWVEGRKEQGRLLTCNLVACWWRPSWDMKGVRCDASSWGTCIVPGSINIVPGSINIIVAIHGRIFRCLLS